MIGGGGLCLREEKIADPSNINKDRMYTEIKAYGLTEATFTGHCITFINRGAKLPS